jgi:spore coat polysaccharide biosynthesis protein SpsF
MKTIAVVQARLRSTRLPGKILLPLPSGRTVLEEVIFRCREASRVHRVVVAIPDSEENDLLLPFTAGAMVVRGPEDDVLERYRRAASTAGADIVVRVTSDCPLIPSEMIDEVIAQRNVHALNYCANNIPERTWPWGYDVECFTARNLYWQAENSWDASSREHVTTSMRRMVEGAADVNVPCPDGDFSHLRWTLDTIDDYIRICRVFEGARGASNLLEVVKQ